MPVQPPTVGVKPQPTDCNGNYSKKLRLTDGSPIELRKPETGNNLRLRCERCNGFYEFHQGYVVMDDFYCDDCTSQLADAGEFCCGN